MDLVFLSKGQAKRINSRTGMWALGQSGGVQGGGTDPFLLPGCSLGQRRAIPLMLVPWEFLQVLMKVPSVTSKTAHDSHIANVLDLPHLPFFRVLPSVALGTQTRVQDYPKGQWQSSSRPCLWFLAPSRRQFLTLKLPSLHVGLPLGDDSEASPPWVSPHGMGGSHL